MLKLSTKLLHLNHILNVNAKELLFGLSFEYLDFKFVSIVFCYLVLTPFSKWPQEMRLEPFLTFIRFLFTCKSAQCQQFLF